MGRFDLAVIGGGSAGLTAAIVAGNVGAKVLLVDKKRLGGDCLHSGCIPSKALIHAARVAHSARTAAAVGVRTGEINVDFSQVMAHVRSRIEAVGEGETPEKLEDHGVEVTFGGARFLSPEKILIGKDREVESKSFVIAVGAKPWIPPVEGLEAAGYLDHKSLFNKRDLPQRLAVVGGGPVGVEMAQALCRLGVEVTLLEAGPRLMVRDDKELAHELQKILTRELNVVCSAKVLAVERNGQTKTVRFQQTLPGEGTAPKAARGESLEVDEVLFATGRRPHFENLNLDAAGVQATHAGVVVDDTLRTTAKNIWACGDCAGSYQFTHFAEAQARVAARNALFRGNSNFRPKSVPWVTFTDPELAHTGLTEVDAVKRGVDHLVYRYPYSQLDRAITDRATEGLAKVVVTPKGKVLGASILGPSAGEAISEVSLALDAGWTLSQIGESIHPYPVMNRVLRRLADQRFFQEGISNWTRTLFGKF